MWTNRGRMLTKNIVLVCILIVAFLVIQQTTGGKNLFSSFLSEQEEDIIIYPPYPSYPPQTTRPPYYYLDCNSSRQCVPVKGFGDEKNLCNNDDFCKNGGHFRCVGAECTPRNGVGLSSCNTNWQCSVLDDPTKQFPPKQK